MEQSFNYRIERAQNIQIQTRSSSIDQAPHLVENTLMDANR